MTTEQRKPIKEVDPKVYQPLLAFETWTVAVATARLEASISMI